MSGVFLRFMAGGITRVVEQADVLLDRFRREDIGSDYYDYKPLTPLDQLVPEDLAVTLLVNSQAGRRAFQSLATRGHTVDLRALPNCSLEKTDASQRRIVAEVITEVANWPGFASSVATKVLHKKRPELIPILDNQAIFGAYMDPRWPSRPAVSNSIKDKPTILRALEAITADLTRSDNTLAWAALCRQEPTRSLIQVFDSVWWMYFRTIQPVVRQPAA